MYVSDMEEFYMAAKKQITQIPKSCEICPDSIIHDNVKMGENVRIGHQCIIYPGVEIGNNCELQDRVILGHRAISKVERPTVIGAGTTLHSNSTVFAGVTIGKNCRVGNNSVIRENNTIGDNCKIGMLVQIENTSVIGNNVFVVAGSHITAYATIEDNVFIGGHVITTNDRQMNRGEIKLKGPTIKRAARIGSNATILPAVVIGEEAVVGAGAVVTKDIPARMVALGVPAKPVKKVPAKYLLDKES